MKNNLIACLLILGSITIATCKKPADEVFNGTSRVRGVVLFNNYLTGTQDTAKTAVITMTMQQGSGTSTPYVQTLANGTFDIQSLNRGTFTLSAIFDFKQPGSTKTDHYVGSLPVTLQTGQFLDKLDVVLNLDSTGTATLQVHIVDAGGAVISNTQVCLYTDPSILAANRGTCGGSLASATTNAQGNAIFSNLQLGNYYVSANVTAGTQVLNNAMTDQTPYNVVSVVKLDTATVTVAATGNSLQLVVADSAGVLLPNVNVCLYTNISLLKKYRGTCTASVRSATTNSQGIVLFTGLQPASYYASAYISEGTDTLSNKTNDTVALTTNGASLATYKLKLLRNAPIIPTTLTLTIVDVNQANIPGASVCLYSDTTLLSKYRGTCTGSLISGTTTANGTVSFTGLQNINYYVSAYKVVGTDTLSNKHSDTKTPIKPLINQVTMQKIEIDK